MCGDGTIIVKKTMVVVVMMIKVVLMAMIKCQDRLFEAMTIQIFIRRCPVRTLF
jgi:hypothetical protein